MLQLIWWPLQSLSAGAALTRQSFAAGALASPPRSDSSAAFPQFQIFGQCAGVETPSTQTAVGAPNKKPLSGDLGLAGQHPDQDGVHTSPHLRVLPGRKCRIATSDNRRIAKLEKSSKGGGKFYQSGVGPGLICTFCQRIQAI